jgi:hypothetical protein
MRYLSEVGIKNLIDLKDKTKIKELGEVLSMNLKDVLINDNSVKYANLRANERRIYTECINPNEWEIYDRKKRHKRKKQFEEIVSKYGTRNWKEQTENMILNKWTYLLNS